MKPQQEAGVILRSLGSGNSPPNSSTKLGFSKKLSFFPVVSSFPSVSCLQNPPEIPSFVCCRSRSSPEYG